VFYLVGDAAFLDEGADGNAPNLPAAQAVITDKPSVSLTNR
jgi:hypothetical protein